MRTMGWKSADACMEWSFESGRACAFNVDGALICIDRRLSEGFQMGGYQDGTESQSEVRVMTLTTDFGLGAR